MKLKLIGAAIDQCAGIQGAIDAPEKLGTLLTDIKVNQILRYSGERNNIPSLESYFTSLACEVHSALTHGNDEFPMVIGGDHSCAIGTWSGVSDFLSQQNQTLGLIWIDAHMDSHTPQTSMSGNIHGMPLATLLGYGYAEFVNILNSNPKLKPENVILIGIRSYEDAEEALLQKLGVKVYYNHDVSKLGFANVFNDAWQNLAARVDKIGLSIDVDGFDPHFTPGVGTTVPDGVDFNQFMLEYKKIDTSRLVAVEITEANPHLDEENKTFNCVVDIVRATQNLIV